MPSALVVGLLGTAAIYVFLQALVYLTQDAEEPPVVGTTLPFLEPLIGMARHKSRFHVHMKNKHGLPMYTLRLPGARMYVVNSTAIISAVQRLYRTISFTAIEAQAATHIMSLSKSANDVVQHGLMKDDSYTMSFAAAIHPAMAPGANLDAMNRASLQAIASSMDTIQAGGAKAKVDLFAWVWHEVLLATTDAVYGPHNPFRDPEIEKAWFQFEPKIMMFALNLLPRVSARTAFNARQRMVAAFVKYFEAGHQNEGSALVRCRYEHSVRFGFSAEDIARCEVGGAFAILGSTIPTSFWLIYHLYSNPAALGDCRQELEHVVNTSQNRSKIDITSIKTKCPILLSTLQEVLRFRHIGVSARVVLQDEHSLAGTYRLKKGSVLMIPTAVYHSDPTVWGPTVSMFDYRRFAPDEPQDTGREGSREKQARKGNSSMNARASYRPFGGGHVLCPGRHFATTEILAFAALAILRFDIEPTAGQKWTEPTIDKSPLVAALPVPDDPIWVDINPRDPHRGWHVELKVSEKAVGIAAEDRED